MNGDLWIERFRREALPRIVAAFEPASVLLFGSRVRGDAREHSDLDVILISSRFAGIPLLTRMTVVQKTTGFPKHVDYLCYTPEEFDRLRHESSVLMDAEEYGVEMI